MPERVYLLNTDWVSAGNRKEIRLHYAGLEIPVSVPEGAVTERVCIPEGMLWLDDPSASLMAGEDGIFRVQAFARVRLCYCLREPMTVEAEGQTILLDTPAGAGQGSVPLPEAENGVLTLHVSIMA